MDYHTGISWYLHSSENTQEQDIIIQIQVEE